MIKRLSLVPLPSICLADLTVKSQTENVTCSVLLDSLQLHPWTIACQAPLSMEFSRQEYWSGLPFPPPGDLPDPGIKLRSPALQEDSLLSEPPGKPIIVERLCIYACVHSLDSHHTPWEIVLYEKCHKTKHIFL